MFGLFNGKKVAALQAQVADLTKRLEALEAGNGWIENIHTIAEQAIDVALDEANIERQIERAFEGVDFEEAAKDAVEQVVANAEFRVRFN